MTLCPCRQNSKAVCSSNKQLQKTALFYLKSIPMFLSPPTASSLPQNATFFKYSPLFTTYREYNLLCVTVKIYFFRAFNNILPLQRNCSCHDRYQLYGIIKSSSAFIALRQLNNASARLFNFKYMSPTLSYAATNKLSFSFTFS